MAKRWSFKEDYIVCKFAYENAWLCIFEDDLDRLMLELKEAGFCSRSEVAISKRIREYQCLFRGEESSYATSQILSTYHVFMYRLNNDSLYESIKSFISETFNPDEVFNDSKDTGAINKNIFSEHNDLTNYVHTIEYCSTFPMVLQKFIDQKGFKKHKEIYDKISMKQDTFSSILRGKYTVVKKENVLRLCVGLTLSVDEAEELMESAGYLFSRGIMMDVVVKAFLMHQCYDTFAIDSELCENNVPALFGVA
jgi:hypothetical protein